MVQNNIHIFNAKVIKVGYQYIGHYRRGELVIQFDCFSIYPKNQFDLYDLFRVFDIDCEDGKFIEDLIGKYCVAVADDKGNILNLVHLTNKNIKWVNKEN